MFHALALPYNRPDLCANAEWNSTAVTFINSTDVGSPILGIFIDSHDRFYALQSHGSRIFTGSIANRCKDLAVISIGNISTYSSPFVTEDRYLYFESGQQPGRIIRRSLNNTDNVIVAEFGGECRGLFIDTNNTLYCGVTLQHRVATKSLKDLSAATIVTRAGTVTAGSSANQLYDPWGIFVDTNFDLYVADPGNNRIQVFRSGNSYGTTVVGAGTHGNHLLSFPTDVVLDKNSNLYIADNNNNRIVRISPIGFQCIAGCLGTNGSAANQFNIAYSLRFDSYGNLFVVDEFNSRVQKFFLTSRCRKILFIKKYC